VDVRVQSSVTTSSDPSNYNNPIFGYGVSATSSADLFTYSGSTNQPPTIAQSASASPNPVSGTRSTLSVLGADDGGEANLVYTWSMVSGPSGAAPVFASNGVNASKNDTVTFNRAGAYTFQVTVTDKGGLSTTSPTAVTVNQTVTTITVSPASVTLAPGGKQQFSAAAYDQFAQIFATQPAFAWSKVSGIGTIGSTGLYTAQGKKTGTAVIQAAASGVTGRATVTVTRTGASPAGVAYVLTHRKHTSDGLALSVWELMDPNDIG
jgi:hypothetical protein